jgi:hypothetical protein
MLLALAGIVYQQVTGQVSIPLLVVYMVVGGLPGADTVIRLVRNWPTESPTPPSVPPSSSTVPGPYGTPSGGESDGPTTMG